MPAGHWVAFEGYDTAHDCKSPVPKSKTSSSGSYVGGTAYRTGSSEYSDIPFADIDVGGTSQKSILPKSGSGAKKYRTSSSYKPTTLSSKYKPAKKSTSAKPSKQATSNRRNLYLVGIIVIGLGLAFWLTSQPPKAVSSLGASPTTRRVIYAGPHVRDYDEIGTINVGDHITLIGRNGDTWVAFEYEGNLAWVQEIFLNIDGNHFGLPEIEPRLDTKAIVTESSNQSDGNTSENSEDSTDSSTETSTASNGCVTANALRIRSGPGMGYSTVGFLSKDDCVSLSGLSTDGNWARIEDGWISVRYLDIIGNPSGLSVDHSVAPPPVVSDEHSGCPLGCTSPPSGCNIKGNISIDTGEKIYHVTGQEYYSATNISPEHGERWFCTEAEAIANGWRKAKR